MVPKGWNHTNWLILNDLTPIFPRWFQIPREGAFGGEKPCKMG